MRPDHRSVVEQLVSDAVDKGHGVTQFRADVGGAELFLAHNEKGFFLVVVPHDQEDATHGEILAGAAARLVELGLQALSDDGGKTLSYPDAAFVPRPEQKPPAGVDAPSLWYAFEYERGPRPRRPLSAPRGRARNLRCPCGSGYKYKRCCGRRVP